VVCLYFLTLVPEVFKVAGRGSYWVIFTYNSLLTCISMQIPLREIELVADEFVRVDPIAEVSHRIVRGGFRFRLT